MDRTANRTVVILFFVALLLRIAYIFTPDNTAIGIWEDQGWTIAKNLVEGRGYLMTMDFGPVVSARPPVFPLFLAGIFLIFGQSVLIVRIFLAIISAFTCLIIYFLAKTMFNKRIGLIAMLISVCYPPFIYWCGYVSQETLTILFLALTVLFLFKSQEKFSYLLVFLSGLSLGFLVMTRSMCYGLIILFFIWLLIVIKNKKHGLLAGCIMLLGTSLIISGWVVRNYRIHHAILLSSTEGGITFYVSNNPLALTKGNRDFYYPREERHADLSHEVKGLSEIQSDRYFFKKGLDFVKNNPEVYFQLMFERFIRFWRFYPHITVAPDSHKPIYIPIMLLTDTPIILLGLWGLVILLKTKRKIAILLLFIFLNFTIVSMLVRGNIRYRTPLMPFLIILSSYVLSFKIAGNFKR